MGEVFVVCAWCKQHQRTRHEQGGDDRTSHTICPVCKAKEMAKLEDRKNDQNK